MFFRDHRGNSGPSLFTVDISGATRVPAPGFASDPAWSPLLSCCCRKFHIRSPRLSRSARLA